jgi:S-DNA-T family DNA segregation ATPase FtsK/SpoIIIE
VTTVAVRRPVRTVRPPDFPAPLVVEAPPAMPEGSGGPGLQTLLPLVGVGASMTVMLLFRGSSFAAIGAVVLVASLLGALAFTLTSRGKAARDRKRLRGLYLDYLDRLREQAAEQEDAWRADRLRAHPGPSALVDLVRRPERLWERRGGDRDFLDVRIGSGTLTAREVTVADTGTAVTPADPFMAAEAQALAQRFRRVADAPVTVPLDRAGRVAVVGDRDGVTAVARLVVSQAAALHAPDDLRIAVVAPPDRVPEWEWARWLPHALVPGPIREAGPQVLIAPTARHLAALLAEELPALAQAAAAAQRRGGGRAESAARPRLLVVDDAWDALPSHLPLPDPALTYADLGVTVVHLCRDPLDAPEDATVRITLDGGTAVVETGGAPVPAVLDPWTAAEAEGLARALSADRLSPDSYVDATSGGVAADLPALLGLDPLEPLDLERRWAPRPGRDFLRVPIGIDDEGAPVLLDLKESAQLGMGPHGMCVGAIGSGKSELLRTLVLALISTHPPEELAVVLIDYKGGAAFAPFARVPHLAGLVTNLTADEALVERAWASLDGEVRRRQELLARVGAVDIGDYRLRRAQSPDPDGIEQLPHLLVIIDEFAELITAKPDFTDLFLRIGRIGRSIGVHLLLSSQRVESGKLRGLDTYLSYRLGLRTFSELESRTVIDTPDAFHLPAVPGVGYLKVDVSLYTRFSAAYVSGPLPEADDAGPPPATRVRRLEPYGARPEDRAADDATVGVRTTGPTLLSAFVDRIAAAPNPPARPVWLPPLPGALGLGEAAAGWRVTSGGVRLAGDADPARLGVPIGRLDDPARQWQGTWVVDLDDGAGHLLVVGGPRSGTSTALATLVLSLAATRTPEDVAVHAIDLDGGALRAVRDLPHVGTVAGRDDPELVRRTIEELHAALEVREELFRERGWPTVAGLRAARAAGRARGLPPSDVVLGIDRWSALTAGFEPQLDLVTDLLTRGGRVGIHVVATARRWNEVRMGAQTAFASRIELRLAEPADSAIEARAARQIPVRTPGRGLTSDVLVGQVALPVLGAPLGDPVEACAQACRLVREAWHGPVTPPVRVLPRVLPRDRLPVPEEHPWRVPIGIGERNGGPVHWDAADDGHLLVVGDSGSGKTNLLRLITTTLAARHSPDDLVFALFDPRRTLRGAVPGEYEGAYADTADAALALTESVRKALADRAAPEARGRGPRIVVVVDDLEQLEADPRQPLAGFQPYLASARDLRTSFVLTRRSGGAGGALYQPLLSGIRAAGAVLLAMSSDPTEGVLLPGLRARVLPAGRGRLVRPGLPEVVVQTALADQ